MLTESGNIDFDSLVGKEGDDQSDKSKDGDAGGGLKRKRDPKNQGIEETSSENIEKKKRVQEIINVDDDDNDDERVRPEGGILAVSGYINWDNVKNLREVKSPQLETECIWSPHRLDILPSQPPKTKGKDPKKKSTKSQPTPQSSQMSKLPLFTLCSSGPSSYHSLLIDVDDRVWSFGLNNLGQLGVGDTLSRSSPCLVSFGQNSPPRKVASLACGRYHSLVCFQDGSAFSFGDNSKAQLGLSSSGKSFPIPQRVSISPHVIKVAAGIDFSLFLTAKGVIYSCGSPEHGQCGHGTDGRYFVTSNKLDFDLVLTPTPISSPASIAQSRITQIAAGNNHCVALSEDGRIFTWGFGGYGRLGHGQATADEFRPKEITCINFPPISLISAGSTATFFYSQWRKITFMSGQTKTSGEANMYPKPLSDLMGWNVRSLASNGTGVLVACDSSVMAWGTTSNYGRLGHGISVKSSAAPKLVEALESRHVLHVAIGTSFSLFLIRPSDTLNPPLPARKVKQNRQ